ncbi:hypothetical protein [Desulfovibrio sp.]|uniref:hypothetical protein n=1 Tax=Desulfovibrio sp. TaxID=885 RepID=UPI003AB20144
MSRRMTSTPAAARRRPSAKVAAHRASCPRRRQATSTMVRIRFSSSTTSTRAILASLPGPVVPELPLWPSPGAAQGRACCPVYRSLFPALSG